MTKNFSLPNRSYFLAPLKFRLTFRTPCIHTYGYREKIGRVVTYVAFPRIFLPRGPGLFIMLNAYSILIYDVRVNFIVNTTTKREMEERQRYTCAPWHCQIYPRSVRNIFTALTCMLEWDNTAKKNCECLSISSSIVKFSHTGNHFQNKNWIINDRWQSFVFFFSFLVPEIVEIQDSALVYEQSPKFLHGCSFLIIKITRNSPCYIFSLSKQSGNHFVFVLHEILCKHVDFHKTFVSRCRSKTEYCTSVYFEYFEHYITLTRMYSWTWEF